MGIFDSKSWDKAFSVLDSVLDDVSSEIEKQTKRASKYWDDNKDDVYEALNKTGDYIDKSLDAGIDWAGKAYHHVKNYVIDVVNQIVDILFITEKVQERRPDALKIMILEKKKHSVNVGIFDQYGDMDQSITINSDYGISNNIYKGQVVRF